MTKMGPVVQKKRYTKKKSPTVELPQTVLTQYSRIENLLRQSLPRNWLRYEFQYDEIEDAFFNTNGTFQTVLSIKFPHLQTNNLTAVEWRKVRKLIVGNKQRRFSSQFVQQHRNDLEKYRQCYNVLQENNRDVQLLKVKASVDLVPLEDMAVCDESPEIDVCNLVIETKKLFVVKSATVAELRQINNSKTDERNADDDAAHTNAIKAVIKLRQYNEEITNKLSQLMRYQLVKDALLFDALEKKRLYLAMSPVYFRRKCQVRIYEDHRAHRSEIFIEAEPVMHLMNALLELIYTLIDYEKLATNAVCYLGAMAQQHILMLQPMMTPGDFEYLHETIMPIYYSTLNKIWA